MAVKAEVTILGNRYKLTSDDNAAEDIEKLAAELNARMDKTAGKGRMLNPLNVSVLTALQLMEELKTVQLEARKVYESLKKHHQEELAKKQSECEHSIEKLIAEHSAELIRLRRELSDELTAVKQTTAQKTAEANAKCAALQRDCTAKIEAVQKEAAAKEAAMRSEHEKLKKDYAELMELLDEA